MRNITEKDIKGFAAAFRKFTGIVSGRRMRISTSEELVRNAFDAGLTADELLNRQNWIKASAVQQDMDPEEYVDILITRGIPVLPIKAEEMWDSFQGGFDIVAEIFHEFYCEIEPKGGTWNTPNAKINLAEVIRDHSLQAVMSEELILRISESAGKGKGDLTCFQYIEALRKCEPETIDDSLTEAQQNRAEEIEREAQEAEPDFEDVPVPDGDENKTEEFHEAEDEDVEYADPRKEDGDVQEPYCPEWDSNDENYEGTDEDFGQGLQGFGQNAASTGYTGYNVRSNPDACKRQAITTALTQLSPAELVDLVQVIPDCNSKTIEELVDSMVKGEANWDREDAKGKFAHQKVNGLLIPYFLSCVSSLGEPMMEDTAQAHDILRESWDIRDANTRKLHKISDAVFGNDNLRDDEDIVEAVRDLGRYYEMLRKAEEEEED